MKIIDILKDSAELLGLREESCVLYETTIENVDQILVENPKIASLFNLIKLSIREICTNYVPIIDEIELFSEDLKIPLNKLENCIRVQNVYSGNKIVKFKTINRNLVFEKDDKYIVSYVMYPSINSLFDDVDFLHGLSPDALVFGLCAYYSLANGMFEEFEGFHDKYLGRAEAIKELKNFDMPVRRWE